MLRMMIERFSKVAYTDSYIMEDLRFLLDQCAKDLQKEYDKEDRLIDRHYSALRMLDATIPEGSPHV